MARILTKWAGVPIFLLLLCRIVWAHPVNETPPNVIKFGIFPYKTPKTIIAIFAPVAKRIEEKLGQKVTVVTAPDHDSFISRGLAGEYDLAFPCVTCYFDLQPAGYMVIARGEPAFYGAVIVRKDSSIQSPAQLKGKKIAAIGRHSYAGFQFLKAQLTELGLNTETDVHFTFLGKLDTIIYGVANKKYDGGVIRLDALKNPAFLPLRDKLAVIAKSHEIPRFPFVIKQNMPAKSAEIIQEILTSYDAANKDDQLFLKGIGAQNIVRAKDSDYDGFRGELKRIEQLGKR